MEYSKKERNKIYIEALRRFKKLNNKDSKQITFGLCFVFASMSQHMEEMVEINKHKPKGTSPDQYWFTTTNPEGCEIREIILIQAIKETE